ncbi:MAG TPA: hypothetical protein VK162_00405, partial [Streptosporangiaceae bacterium]|nr:hypothetical protein [Streptosporangiaceae bacterium]
MTVASSGPSSAEDWSRAGWRAHLARGADPCGGTSRLGAACDGELDALVERLGGATIPELAAASAARVPDRIAVTIDRQPT